MSSPIRASKHSRNFRYPLQVEAGADRLAQQPDYATHVEEMIRQILLTDHGERVMRPDLGTTLYSLVFEPLRGASATMIRASVHAPLETHLGALIEVLAVKVVRAQDMAAVGGRWRSAAPDPDGRYRVAGRRR